MNATDWLVSCVSAAARSLWNEAPRAAEVFAILGMLAGLSDTAVASHKACTDNSANGVAWAPSVPLPWFESPAARIGAARWLSIIKWKPGCSWHQSGAPTLTLTADEARIAIQVAYRWLSDTNSWPSVVIKDRLFGGLSVYLGTVPHAITSTAPLVDRANYQREVDNVLAWMKWVRGEWSHIDTGQWDDKSLSALWYNGTDKMPYHYSRRKPRPGFFTHDTWLINTCAVTPFDEKMPEAARLYVTHEIVVHCLLSVQEMMGASESAVDEFMDSTTFAQAQRAASTKKNRFLPLFGVYDIETIGDVVQKYVFKQHSAEQDAAHGNLRRITHSALSIGWCIAKTYTASFYAQTCFHAEKNAIGTLRALSDRADSRVDAIRRAVEQQAQGQEVPRNGVFDELVKASQQDANDIDMRDKVKPLNSIVRIAASPDADSSRAAQKLLLFNQESARKAACEASVEQETARLGELCVILGMQSCVSVLHDTKLLPTYLVDNSNSDPISQCVQLCMKHTPEHLRNWRAHFKASCSAELKEHDACTPLFKFLDKETVRCYGNAAIVDQIGPTCDQIKTSVQKLCRAARDFAAADSVVFTIKTVDNLAQSATPELDVLCIATQSEEMRIGKLRHALEVVKQSLQLGITVYGESLCSRAKFAATAVRSVADNAEEFSNELRRLGSADSDFARRELPAIGPELTSRKRLTRNDHSTIKQVMAQAVSKIIGANITPSAQMDQAAAQKFVSDDGDAKDAATFVSSVLLAVRCVGVVAAVNSVK